MSRLLSWQSLHVVKLSSCRSIQVFKVLKPSKVGKFTSWQSNIPRRSCTHLERPAIHRHVIPTLAVFRQRLKTEVIRRSQFLTFHYSAVILCTRDLFGYSVWWLWRVIANGFAVEKDNQLSAGQHLAQCWLRSDKSRPPRFVVHHAQRRLKRKEMAASVTIDQVGWIGRTWSAYLASAASTIEPTSALLPARLHNVEDTGIVVALSA